MCDHHHGGSCAHEHTEEPEAERGAEYSLYQFIDTSGLTCLNERGSGTALKVFKPWDQRLDRTSIVESDTDEQLIFHIPFTASIKLKAINIIGGTNGSSPSKLKAWINREDIDFSSVDDVATLQEWELAENPLGEIEYPTRITKFQSVTSLTLYIPENFGADRTVVSYIGLKGEYKTLSRKAVNVVYESSAQLKDHKVPDSEEQMARHIGS